MTRRYLKLHQELIDILEMIEKNRVSARDIADKMGISLRTAYRKVNDLRKVGYNIQSKNIGKKSYYYIVNKEGN